MKNVFATIRDTGRRLLVSLREPRLKAWLVLSLVLLAVYAPFGWQLARFAADSDLYSHILLIPFVSLALVWMDRDRLRAPEGPVDFVIAALFGIPGLLLAIMFAVRRFSGPPQPFEDAMAISTAAALLLFWAICGACFGRKLFRTVFFPLAFLVFLIPLPTSLLAQIQHFLQYGSAYAAHAFFRITGTPVFRQDLVFQLSNISIEVAPQCSGIHSTLALFITSIVAGKLFLESPWKRTALAAAVLPLALLRNGFRVFTLGELCVRIGPEMIDSYIHHRGGPIFFALSLIPFGLLLFLLMRGDRAKQLQNA